MKITKLVLIAFCLLPTFSSIYGANYYIASNGNDGNNGLTEQTPWQTISKVNSMMNVFNPGDKILFRRGDQFTGSINITKSGTAGNEITFGSYGVGNKPIITGKKQITGWTVYSGSIYRAPITDSVSQLYISGSPMTIARFPNSGFLKIDAGNGNIGFSDAALTQAAGFFNGAKAKVRTINWKYETRTISNFSGGNITFTASTTYPPSPNYGYYIDNKLNLLDAPGEWFCDIAGGFIYLYAPGGVNPNTLLVEGVVYNSGLYQNLTSNYIIIRDLKVSGYKLNGILLSGGSNNAVRQCEISYAQKYAILMNGTNHVIDSNTLIDNLNIGISGVYTNGLISNNRIRRTGLTAGYGEEALLYLGMQIHTSVGLIVEYNEIDSTGYSGMFAGKNMIVRKNIINSSCMTLNDGSCIDIAQSDGLQITNNIIKNCIGSVESSSSPSQYAHGISFSPSSTKNVLVQGNTIAFNRYDGIYVDNKNPADNNLILDNIFYDNYRAQISFTDFSATSFSPTYNTEIRGNIFYCLSSRQVCMEQQMYHSTVFSDFGNFDSNYYCNPYYEFMIRRTIVSPFSTKLYRLNSWKNFFNDDLHSIYSPFSFEQYKVLDTIGNNLITNSKFISNINGWSTWPPPGSTIAFTTHPLLDTGCMRIRWNGIGFTQSFTQSNTWSVTKGDYFLAAISCVGNNAGELNSGTSLSVTSSPVYNFSKQFAYENFRKNHSYIFRIDTNDASARLSISLALPDSLLYVDNVSLHKVLTEKLDSTQLSKLFANETNFTQTYSLGGLTYKEIDGTPVTGSIMVLPYSSRILIHDAQENIKNLELQLLIEGFYNPAANAIIQDTARIYLRNVTSPYTLRDSSKQIYDTGGNLMVSFSKANYNENYYVVVKHRNSIETWSSVGISFQPSVPSVNYSFTTAASQAYGNNLFQVDVSPVRFAIYGGDITQEGSVDVSDIIRAFNDANAFLSGYVVSDVTGDNFVDLSDVTLVFNNSNRFVTVVRP